MAYANDTSVQTTAIIAGCLAVFFLLNSLKTSQAEEDASNLPDSVKKITEKIDRLIDQSINDSDYFDVVIDLVSEQSSMIDAEAAMTNSRYYVLTKKNSVYITYPFFKGECNLVYLATPSFIIKACFDLKRNEVVRAFSHASVKKTKEDREVKPRRER